jgi:hypothetical protein
MPKLDYPWRTALGLSHFVILFFVEIPVRDCEFGVALCFMCA